MHCYVPCSRYQQHLDHINDSLSSFAKVHSIKDKYHSINNSINISSAPFDMGLSSDANNMVCHTSSSSFYSSSSSSSSSDIDDEQYQQQLNNLSSLNSMSNQIEQANIDTESDENDQCLYNNYSNSNNSELWSLDEDIMLCNLQREMGNDWSSIAKGIPNRSRVAVKTRFRSISRAAKKHWTEEHNILLLKAYAGFNYTWNEGLLIMFPTRTRNALKIHIQELLHSDPSLKEYVPLGSPKQILVNRPDLVRSLFSPIVAIQDSTSTQQSTPLSLPSQPRNSILEFKQLQQDKKVKLTTPPTKSRIFSDSNYSQSPIPVSYVDSTKDMVMINHQNDYIDIPSSFSIVQKTTLHTTKQPKNRKRSKSERLDDQNDEEIECDLDNQTSKGRKKSLTKRQRTLIALMNQSTVDYQITPLSKEMIEHYKGSELWDAPISANTTEESSAEINSDDIEKLIMILS